MTNECYYLELHYKFIELVCVCVCVCMCLQHVVCVVGDEE